MYFYMNLFTLYNSWQKGKEETRKNYFFFFPHVSSFLPESVIGSCWPKCVISMHTHSTVLDACGSFSQRLLLLLFETLLFSSCTACSHQLNLRTYEVLSKSNVIFNRKNS